MKKSDLKTGMWIEFKDGRKAMVLLNTNRGDIFSGINAWGEINDYNEDLTYRDMFKVGDMDKYSIVKIYDPSSNMAVYNFEGYDNECIWERKEVKKNDCIIDMKIAKEILSKLVDTDRVIDKLHETLKNIRIDLIKNEKKNY